jgi:HEAT repeat protein
MLASRRVDERIQGRLESSDPGERLEGLRAVALYEDLDATPLVARILASDPEPEVREHAVRALGVTLGAAALEALLRAARADRDPMVRRTALVVLGETGERAVGRALASLLDPLDAHDQAAAIDALRACGAKEELSALLELARSGSPHVRALVVHAWAALADDPRAAPTPPGRVAPPEVIAAAEEVAAKGPLWARPAAALARGEDPAAALAASLPRSAPRDRESAVHRALDLPARAALECLRAIAAFSEEEGDREVGLAAARELARRGDPAGARVLARVLHEPEGRGRTAAAIALVELGAPMGESLLLGALESTTAPDRAAVARALALAGRSEGLRALGALLSSDLPQDRRFAAIGFAELGRSDGAAELVRSLDYPLRSERADALAALRQLWPEGPAVDARASAAERRPSVATYAAHFGR